MRGTVAKVVEAHQHAANMQRCKARSISERVVVPSQWYIVVDATRRHVVEAQRRHPAGPSPLRKPRDSTASAIVTLNKGLVAGGKVQRQEVEDVLDRDNLVSVDVGGDVVVEVGLQHVEDVLRRPLAVLVEVRGAHERHDELGRDERAAQAAVGEGLDGVGLNLSGVARLALEHRGGRRESQLLEPGIAVVAGIVVVDVED